MHLVSKGFVFLGSIYTFKILGPSEVGLAASYIAIYVFGSLFCDLGLSVVGVRSVLSLKKEEKVPIILDIINVKFYLSLVVNLIFLIVYIIFGNRLLSVSSLFLGFIFIINTAMNVEWIFQANNLLKKYSLLQLINGIVQLSLIIVLYQLNANANIYIGCLIFSQTITNFLGYKLLGFYPIISLVNFSKIKYYIIEGRYAFGSVLAIYVYTALELPLIGILSNIEMMGIYKAAQQIPLGITPLLALAPLILYPKLNLWKLQDLTLLRNNFLRSIFILTIISILLALFLTIFHHYFFIEIYDERYVLSQTPSLVLCISKCIVLIGVAPVQLLYVFRKDKILLKIMIIVGLISIALNLLLIPSYGIFVSSLINLFSEILVTIICFILAWPLLKKPGSRT
jgi:O-antigen/teichoic acid export membrane protein